MPVRNFEIKLGIARKAGVALGGCVVAAAAVVAAVVVVAAAAAAIADFGSCFSILPPLVALLPLLLVVNVDVLIILNDGGDDKDLECGGDGDDDLVLNANVRRACGI